MKKRVISGITATGNLTLGNYIGSIKNLVEKQDEYEIFMFVADLHGITLPIEPNTLRENVKRQLLTYISCGIDINKVYLFKQSEIIGHTELFYYLTTISNEGQLKRMTQYKDKSLRREKNKTDKLPLGLLVYPILMASDIILYDVDGVIVGEDQKQHLELTRDLVLRLNNLFSLNLKVPEPIIPKIGAKINALKTPTKKMSKSDNDVNETIFLLDDIEVVRKKIMTALTDSENIVKFDEKNKPGVSNLLTIFSVLKGISISESETYFKNKNYKFFKIKVSEVVIEFLKKIQLIYNSISDDEIEIFLEKNRNHVQKIANKNLYKIEKGIGIK